VRKPAFALTLVAVSLAALPVAHGDENDHSTGGRAIPVHRLVLRDENDISILPTMPRAWPLSTKTTCGACHDYDKITGGFHFNAGCDGRPGEPWVWVDRATGTQLPLAHRKRDGVWKPEEIGITAWRFTQLFARHLPGAGVAEPSDDEALTDGAARWTVSGKIEANCLGCHQTSDTYSPSEWAKQCGRENFRWAATAAAGLGDVGGMASRQSDVWIPTTSPGPDPNVYNIPPAVQYDATLFDTLKFRTYLKVGKPTDARCLNCHSVTDRAKPKWQVSGDVHSAAGMTCVSCHRNGEDHAIIRGYTGEAAHRKNPAVGELSCRGCHLGVEGAEGALAMGGRLGAPKPKHPGLPAVHIEKMTCTACHSGPWPGKTPTKVWTSRSNRLGIAGQAQWRTETPVIVEPVFMRNASDMIAPHRMMWPAYWAKLDGDKVTPVLPDDITDAAKGILDAPEQVGTILGLLAPRLIADENEATSAKQADEDKIGGTPVLIAGGKLYRRNIDGALDAEDYDGPDPGVSPYWARDKNGEILPLIRLKDTPDSEPDKVGDGTALDERLMEMIRALDAPKLGLGQPVVDTGAKVYERAIVRTDHGGGSITYDITLVEVEGVAGSAGTPQMPVFAWLVKGDGDQRTLKPLVPDFVVSAVTETVDTDKAFTEAQAALMLQKLAADRGGTYAYVNAGKLFSLSDGKLVAGDNPAAEAVSWPMAHDVRPASQSLGAGGCTDCHSLNSPMLDAQIAGIGPMKTEAGSVKPMHELAELSNVYHTMFGLTFLFRPIFKTVLITMACIILAVLLAYGILAIRRLARYAGTKE